MRLSWLTSVLLALCLAQTAVARVPYLKSLKVQHAPTRLDQELAISRTEHSFKLTVGSAVDWVAIRAETSVDTDVVTETAHGGAPFVNYTSAQFQLQQLYEYNTLTVTVTSAEGNTTNYVINIFRLSICNVVGITVAPGQLSPPFDIQHDQFTAAVKASVAKIDVTVSVDESQLSNNCSLLINGVKTAPNVATSVEMQQTNFNLDIKFADHQELRWSKVTVTPTKSRTAKLLSLRTNLETLDPPYRLQPAFSPETLKYTVPGVNFGLQAAFTVSFDRADMDEGPSIVYLSLNRPAAPGKVQVESNETTVDYPLLSGDNNFQFTLTPQAHTDDIMYTVNVVVLDPRPIPGCPMNCSNHGFCYADPKQNPVCQCDAQYSGENCAQGGRAKRPSVDTGPSPPSSIWKLAVMGIAAISGVIVVSGICLYCRRAYLEYSGVAGFELVPISNAEDDQAQLGDPQDEEDLFT